MIRRLMLLCALTGTMLGQGVRHDSNATTTAKNVPAGASANIMTVPNAIVTICGFPAVGSPCTNTVSLFSDQALTQPIANPLSADAMGRWGFWVFPGIYTYTIQTQSGTVVGNYSLSLNTIGISASPSAGQAVQQPSGTSLDSNVFNHTYNATLFAGPDIGAKVNAAIAALITAYGGGTVYVPAGTYAITAPIVIPARVNFLGAGADSTQFTWAGTGAAFILSSVPHDGLDIATQVGGFVLTGTNTANQYGIYQGGDYTCTGGCTRNPSTNIGYDYSLHDISIYNMDYGIWWGYGTFNERWDNVLVSGSTHYGWYYPATSGFGGQNNHFYHSHLGGNLAGGFFVQQLPEVTFSMHGMDIEYNGTPAVPGGPAQMQGGNYQCFDCHVESYFGPLVSVFANNGSAAFYGGFFVVNSPAATTETGVFKLAAGRDTIVLDAADIQVSHPVTNLITQTAGSNQPQVTFRNNTLIDTDAFLGAVTNVTGQGVSWCLPWNPSSGGNGSCYDGNVYTNPIGTIANNPPLSSLPGSGNYLGWNSTGQNNSDFINTFNGAYSTDTAHRWLVNNGGTFVEVGRINRDGSFVSPGKNSATGYSVTGGAAWTSGAVDPKGSCVSGSMYSNTAGVSGHAFWTCVSGAWVDVK